jgi:heme exporter protein D
MIPDLDGYAATVLGAYGVAFALIGLLVAASWWRSARVQRDLSHVEARLRGGRDEQA